MMQYGSTLPRLVIALLCLILLPRAAGAQEAPFLDALPELPSLEQDQDVPIDNTPNEPIVTQTPAQNASINAALNWRGSMMFKRKELDIIYALLDGVNIEAELLIEDTGLEEGSLEENKLRRENIRITRIVPGYNLNSILYFSRGNWSFWLNEKKYTPASSVPPNFNVLDVNEYSVTMVWQDPNLDDIVPNWKQDYVPFDANKANRIYVTNNVWDFMSPDGNVLVSSSSGAVQFTLKPHQSFQTYSLSVVEGKSKSYYVNFIPGRGTAALVPLDVDITTLTPEALNALIEQQVQEQKKQEEAAKKAAKAKQQNYEEESGVGDTLKNMVLDQFENIGARNRTIQEFQQQNP